MATFENGGEAATPGAMASETVCATQSAQRVEMAPDQARRRNWRPSGRMSPGVYGGGPGPYGGGPAGGGYMNRRQYQSQFVERERDADKTKAQVITMPEACKEVTVSGHQNARGSFIRLQELDTRRGIRDMVCIPAEGLEELITALQHVAMEMHAAGLMPAAKEG